MRGAASAAGAARRDARRTERQRRPEAPEVLMRDWDEDEGIVLVTARPAAAAAG